METIIYVDIDGTIGGIAVKFRVSPRNAAGKGGRSLTSEPVDVKS